MRTGFLLKAGAALAGLASLASPARADAPAPRGTIVVTLGDGSTVPLRNWTLSYEYALFRQGTSPLSSPTARKDTDEVFVGKRTLETAGKTLTFSYLPVPQALIDAGTAVETDRFKRPTEVVLTGKDGKRAAYKIEPPHKDLLNDDPPPGMSVVPRTFDLRGETVTGTKKDFCMVSYTAAVECGSSPPTR